MTSLVVNENAAGRAVAAIAASSAGPSIPAAYIVIGKIKIWIQSAGAAASCTAHSADTALTIRCF